MSDPTDVELNCWLVPLVERAGDGDRAAFAELYALTESRVRAIVRRVLTSPDDAADVTQEVFVQVWLQADRYQPDKGRVMAWLTTIAQRRAIDRVRHDRNVSVRDERYSSAGMAADVDDVWERVSAASEIAELHQGVSRLSDLQREALSLAYFRGHTHSQIAALLEVPLGTVKTRIRDGLISLRMTINPG